MWLFALFLLVPLIEIALFITVGGWLTLWPTLALVILTGVVGTMLMRWQGLQVLAQLRGDVAQMRNPLSPLAHGGLIVVAGLLLLTPGFFTDTLGLLLMIPGVRQAVISAIGRRIEIRTVPPRGSGPTVIDGEFIELDTQQGSRPPRGPSGWTRH